MPRRPASLSAALVGGLLRQRLGWKGLLVSDDLGMKAVADRYTIEELVVEGVRVGVDHFIIRGPRERQQAAWEALVRTAELDGAFRARVEESAASGSGAQGPPPGAAASVARAAGGRFPVGAPPGAGGIVQKGCGTDCEVRISGDEELIEHEDEVEQIHWKECGRGGMTEV